MKIGGVLPGTLQDGGSINVSLTFGPSWTGTFTIIPVAVGRPTCKSPARHASIQSRGHAKEKTAGRLGFPGAKGAWGFATPAFIQVRRMTFVRLPACRDEWHRTSSLISERKRDALSISQCARKGDLERQR